MDEKQLLSSLIIMAEDTVDFLTQARKWERECWVCSEFVKALDVNVSPNDLVKPSSEPPDVIVNGANFEVYIVMERYRRLNADWKNKVLKYRNAQVLQELLQPYSPPQKISAEQILEFLMPTLLNKHHKYSKRQVPLGEIDVLAYVNLENFILDLETTCPLPFEFQKQGWRSVSIFGNSYCRVLYAGESAPDFLCLHADKTIRTT